jgi:hypothetical protein
MSQVKVKKNETVKVEVRVSNSQAKQDKIVITAKKFHKVIPALLFSPEQSKTLLDIVEFVEQKMQSKELIK